MTATRVVCVFVSWFALVATHPPLVAAAKPPSKLEPITVCVAASGDSYDDGTAEVAQVMAGRMFHTIGINIKWHREVEDCPRTPAGSIVVTFPRHVPPGLGPDAFASALPFEGIHLEIYLWRIPHRVTSYQATFYQATFISHLLVHEITHLLEGLAHHSDSGIMKASWDAADINQMMNGELRFSEQDMRLIGDGIRSRQTRLATSASGVGSGRLLAAIE
jgi:hypothetical protein